MIYVSQLGFEGHGIWTCKDRRSLIPCLPELKNSTVGKKAVAARTEENRLRKWGAVLQPLWSGEAPQLLSHGVHHGVNIKCLLQSVKLGGVNVLKVEHSV